MHNSLIVPHFNYSVLSWGFDTNRLSKLQKRAIRIISRSKYNSHTEPINEISQPTQNLRHFHASMLDIFYINVCTNVFLYFFFHYFCKMLLIMIFPQGNVIKSLSHAVKPREPENVLDNTYQLYLEKCHYTLWIKLIRIVCTVFLHTRSNTY